MKTLYLPKRGFLLALIILAILFVLLGLLWKKPDSNSKFVILGFNDLGMHCIQPDYSKFFILPPGNNILVQIFQRGAKPTLVTKGIIVKYKINSQEDPTKYTNFWDYASQYGFNLPKGVGITGNRQEGTMQLDPTKRYWEALAIPVTSKTGGKGPASPYQTATITVLEQKTNKILAKFDKLVVPVSPEMDCLNCHKTWSKILRDHDDEEKTSLYSDFLLGKLHRCSECHGDPILNEPGKSNLPSLSLAMHGFHSDKITTNIRPVCFNCHPGRQTKCNRGVMQAANLDCVNCHGNMKQVAASIKLGRTPWLQEPGCQKCHQPKYKVNPGQLYRRSYLENGPDEDMNNKILCASCHNSPHAEWPSLLELDNILPRTYQRSPIFIKKCSVCHFDQNGTVHQ